MASQRAVEANVHCTMRTWAVDPRSEGFVAYYLARRQHFADAAERVARRILGASEADAAAKAALDETKHNELLMAFGEVALSYLSEEEDNIFLTRAGWWTEPYTIKQGTDLVGVDLDSGRVVYFESKGSAGTGFQASTLKSIADQLARSYLEARIKNPVKSESFLGIKAAYASSPRRPTKPLIILDPGKEYGRIGCVTAPGDSYYQKLHDANPGDADGLHPVSLVQVRADAAKGSAHAQYLLEAAAVAAMAEEAAGGPV